MKRLVLLVMLAAAWASLDNTRASAQTDPIAELKRTYAALTSYRDTTTVLVESQIPGAPKDDRRFTVDTAYLAPKTFFLDSRPVEAGAGDRFVVWSGGETFETWWSATNVHEKYPPGGGVAALTAGSLPTSGASVNIASLLFPTAELHSTIYDFSTNRTARETLNGRAVTVLTGSSTGHFGSPRPVTITIDVSTGLLVAMVEDTPLSAPAGTVDRVTTTIQPEANPPLLTSRFTFTPPRP